MGCEYSNARTVDIFEFYRIFRTRQNDTVKVNMKQVTLLWDGKKLYSFGSTKKPETKSNLDRYYLSSFI